MKGGVSNFKQIILLLWIRIGYEYRYLWMHRKKYTNCQVLPLIYPPIIIYCNLTYLQYLFRIDDIFEIYALNVVETQITEIIEERIAGVEGIRFISSKSEDGLSTVTIEFGTGRDVDGAANDIRDRVSAILGDLPEEADPPVIQKVDSNDDVIMWLNLVSDRMTVPELTDYADRYLVDKFSVLNGVARVRIGSGQIYAKRIWLDRKAMAARNLVVSDIENSLRA